MMNGLKAQVAPSILSADFCKLGEEVAKVEGLCEFLHVDIMDGHFVPNISFGIPVVKALRSKTDMVFDTHLMISDPEAYIPRFVEAGSDFITFHYETTDNPSRVIGLVKSLGVRVGMAIHPDTPIDVVVPYIKDLDLVLVMGVRPGFGGQSYLDGTSERIAFVRKHVDEINPDCIVSIDGGACLANIDEIVNSGANLIVAGTSVFAQEDARCALEEMLECIARV